MAAPLSGERWRRLDSIFQKALDCAPEHRAALLDRETEGDPDLRREVEEMLVCDSEAQQRIAAGIAGVAQMAASGGEWTGRRIGPYRLLREIGHGGMGIVFEATRDDAEYRKTVALKLVPAWRGQPELIERFRQERQILAGLDHPNIARLLDGGTADGIPYFVMEYVDGVTLTEWRRREPGLRESIRLFREVCAAVHCAHENLVVHRDLKPANILVNRDGLPKLLDFGIAKLLAALPGEDAATTGFRPWTPDYASPEQVRGGPITTRSDVYSLGLILYELLCGERAQTADPSSPLALDRSICEAEPAPPSARAGARADTTLARQLRGDLDTIVAMAISKEPQRRYSSVAAFSADLERWQQGRPVVARPATPLYRFAKLVRRRRVAFAAAALVAATAAGGAISTVHQAQRAERRFQQVRSLANAFVFDVYDRIQYLPGATEARKAIVSTALRYLESLRQDASGDASLALELAAAYQRIGDVQGHPLLPSLHDTKGAMSSYSAARTLLAPLQRQGDQRADLPMAEIELKLGMIEFSEGRGDEAEDRFKRALAIARRIIGRKPDDIAALKLAGDITSEMGVTAMNRRDPVRGRQATEETVEIARRLAALQPSSLAALEYLAAAQSSLGSACFTAGELQNALRSFRESAATRERLLARQPLDTNYRRSLMMSYGHLADILGSPLRTNGIGDMDAASAALAKASQIAEEMVRQDPSNRTARQDLANASYRAGDLLFDQPGRMAAALEAFEKSERILNALLAEDPANENGRYVLLYVQRRIGETLELLGRDGEAAHKLAIVRSLAPRFAGTKDAARARFMAMKASIALARIKVRAGDPTTAALVDGAAAEANGGAMPTAIGAWSRAETYAELGRLFLQLGRKGDAAQWLSKSIATLRELKAPAELEAQRAMRLASAEADFENARR